MAAHARHIREKWSLWTSLPVVMHDDTKRKHICMTSFSGIVHCFTRRNKVIVSIELLIGIKNDFNL